MSRYLLIIMSILAVSACTDNRPYGNTSRNPDSTHRYESGDSNNTDSSRPGNRTNSRPNESARTDQSRDPSKNEVGSAETESTDRTAVSPSPTSRGDRKDSTVTAGDQSESETDRKITQQIRKAVVDDATLSVKAQNCTIVTIAGVVTLRGPVDTASERMAIGSKADAVTGVRRVNNQLEIIR